MKTWRERIAEARERGVFAREDQRAWVDIWTCPAGEVAKRFGLPYTPELWNLGDAMSTCLYEHNFDPDGAEKILDSIEDRALKLKRQQ